MRKFAVWSSLISQILIVVTGAVVRLTGSGLGCPTWPKCTAESLVTVKEQGIHGVIEFGNRLLTFVLVLIAVFAIAMFWKTSLRWITIVLFAGIPLQALIGGISVWTKLNPWIVGLHFVASAGMIAFASLLVWRFYESPVPQSERKNQVLSSAILVFGLIAVIVGVLVTGAGPHAGDADAPRNGLDLAIWQHYHSYPAYLTLAMVIVQTLLVRANRKLFLINLGLLLALVLQAFVGVLQARLGVPAPLVAIHVFGAATICSLLWFQKFATRR